MHPFPEPDALGDLEHRVLAALMPPLNIDGMPSTSLRRTLSRLRAPQGLSSSCPIAD